MRCRSDLSRSVESRFIVSLVCLRIECLMYLSAVRLSITRTSAVPLNGVSVRDSGVSVRTCICEHLRRHSNGLRRLWLWHCAEWHCEWW